MENQLATDYLVLAVGGSGAKVAEAMIDLLCLGIPLTVDNAGTAVASQNAADSLTVVRIDPDKACRSASLQEAVSRYQEIRRVGGQGTAHGLWSLQLRNLVTIHPMDALSGPAGVETLEAKLASKAAEHDAAMRLLRLFYNQADLVTSLDRGFFQKPYIGAAVIASMGGQKIESDSPLPRLLQGFKGKRLRVFVVGSMYGGTGAAGLPVLSRIVTQIAAANHDEENWQVAGCLLGPYFYPPAPPIDKIDWGGKWRPESGPSLDDFLGAEGRTESDYLEEVRGKNAGSGLAGNRQDFSYEEIRQIARGYYAKPDEIERRAVASWDYYQHHGSDLFDELYLVGLRNPTRYSEVVLRPEDYPEDGARFEPHIRWSNGGQNQISPLHAVEFASAGLGLHFFSKGTTQDKGTSLLAVHHHDSSIGDALCWGDLAVHPSVRVDRWLYAALASYNWLAFGLLPHIATQQSFENASTSLPALHRFVSAEHYAKFHDDLNSLAKHIGDALLHATRALGWEEEETAPLMYRWLRTPTSFGRTGTIFHREAESYSFPHWLLQGVDAEKIGRSVPATSVMESLRGVSNEAKGSDPLGIAYLQSLWNYMASHLDPVQDGIV